MAAITKIHENKSSLLSRFIGDDVRVMHSILIPVNNCISATQTEVIITAEDQPEEQGKLYLFPIDDNKYCLQLFYLQYADARSEAATIYSIKFLPEFFDQYPAEALIANQPFRFDQTTEQQFSICIEARLLLEKLVQQEKLTPFLRSLKQTDTALQLLARALQCITLPFDSCQLPACRFLAYDTEREKIQHARAIMEQQIDQPLTIRELSRKVAMNECYLKKGFKALTGKTIHEYQQDLRINKAKDLLQLGKSVSEVSLVLGYSSISHFSTAFKRVTGMKPCELLA